MKPGFKNTLLKKNRTTLHRSIIMGGGPGGFNPRDYHNWYDETAGAHSTRHSAAYYRQQSAYALANIYRELDNEQTRIQTNAFAKEMQALLNTKDIEWKIFEQEVMKAQANYIANLYTNRIILELKNLDAILSAK